MKINHSVYYIKCQNHYYNLSLVDPRKNNGKFFKCINLITFVNILYCIVTTWIFVPYVVTKISYFCGWSSFLFLHTVSTVRDLISVSIFSIYLLFNKIFFFIDVPHSIFFIIWIKSKVWDTIPKCFVRNFIELYLFLITLTNYYTFPIRVPY